MYTCSKFQHVFVLCKDPKMDRIASEAVKPIVKVYLFALQSHLTRLAGSPLETLMFSKHSFVKQTLTELCALYYCLL